MEWWVWVLLIIALLVLGIVIWYWLRMRAVPSAPAVRDSHASGMAPDHDHDGDHDNEAPPSWSQPAPTSVAELAAMDLSAPVKADDLTLIEGIGPRIRDVLAEAEITTFSQLADTQPDRIEEILRAAKLPPTSPGSWPEQAGLAAEGRMDELQRLQDSLKGGR